MVRAMAIRRAIRKLRIPGRLSTGSRRLLAWGEAGLAAAGVTLLATCLLAYAEARLDQARGERLLEELRVPPPAAPAAAAPSSRDAGARAAAPESPRRLGRFSLVGRIDIPRIHVSAIVREGVDSQTLRRAVGHVPGTALPGAEGTVCLAGHRDTYFHRLGRLRAGDVIELATPEGSYAYTVEETAVVGPREVRVLAPTPVPALTLVTCYPFTYLGSAPRRFVVRAVRSGAAPVRGPVGRPYGPRPSRLTSNSPSGTTRFSASRYSTTVRPGRRTSTTVMRAADRIPWNLR